MAEERVLSELPFAYAVALRLRDDGHGEADVARALGIEPAAVGSLLALADAKLAELLAQRTAHETVEPRCD